jgi:hypothetical protein
VVDTFAPARIAATRRSRSGPAKGELGERQAVRIHATVVC